MQCFLNNISTVHLKYVGAGRKLESRHSSGTFPFHIALEGRDALSPHLFNLALEYANGKVQ
jgi:hypothetical protein